MTETRYLRVTILLAALLATIALALVATGKPARATFPGTSGAIAFVSNQDGGTDANNIYRMNVDGFGQPLANEVMAMKAAPEEKTNKPVNLSNSPADDMYPTWSPDGKKVAFTSNRAAEDGTTDYDVWRVSAKDGANPTNLTNAPGNDTDPTWQPLP